MGFGVDTRGRQDAECNDRESARLMAGAGREVRALAIQCSTASARRTFGSAEACMNYDGGALPVRECGKHYKWYRFKKHKQYHRCMG